MTSKNKHIIRKEVLELTVPGKNTGLTIQNKVSEIVRRKLNPALDSIFSDILPNGETVRIDKLVIDLGTISKEDLAEDFVERAATQIREKVSQLAAESRQKTALSESGPAEIIPDGMKDLQLFAFFLRNGCFPWWHVAEEIKQPEDLIARIIRYDSKTLKTFLAPVFLENIITKRLVYQFDEKHLNLLLQKTDSEQFQHFKRLFQHIPVPAGVSGKEWIRSFHTAAFPLIGEGVAETGDERQIAFLVAVIREAVAKYPAGKKETVLANMLKKHLEKIQDQPEKKEVFLIAAIRAVSAGLPDKGQKIEKTMQALPPEKYSAVYRLLRQMPGITHQVRRRDDRAAIQEAARQSETGTKNIRSEPLSSPVPEPDTGGEGIIVSNAGLVLLHPLLKYFFDGLGLLDKKLMFRDEKSAFRAVHLLHFMATGKENTAEHELVLNKVLCGMKISEPVPKEMPLTKTGKRECIHLLKTVLERWKALRTVNPDALRQTYLVREGLLSESGQGRKLTVERNSFDVMLEKLPWSVSIIRFPWSSQILFVEW